MSKHLFTCEQEVTMRIDIRRAIDKVGRLSEEDAFRSFELAGFLLEANYSDSNSPFLCSRLISRTNYSHKDKTSNRLIRLSHYSYEHETRNWLVTVVQTAIAPRETLLTYLKSTAVQALFSSQYHSEYVQYRNAWVDLLVDEILGVTE